MGLFGAAGVNVADQQDDPYGFGKSHWPLFVKEVREPKVSDSGKFGSYMLFEVAHDKYATLRPFGRWIQLPTPSEIQAETGVAFDPEENLEDMKVVNFLVKFMVALGFGIDEIAADKVGLSDMEGKVFLAKIAVSEGESGYDEFRWFNPKAFDPAAPEGGSGLEEFRSETSSNPDPVAAAEAALAKDIADA